MISSFMKEAAERGQGFEKSQEENLGHLEEGLKTAACKLLAETLQLAAQKKADATPPNCPKCGRRLVRRRRVERTATTGLGEIKISRVRGYCSRCKEWFCPADERLGLESGYSPKAQELAALFASKMPVAEASAMMKHVTGVQMPPATLDRVAKQAARKAQTLRKKLDEEARQRGEALAGPPLAATQTLIIMIDAWHIRERDDWGRSAALRRKGVEPQRWHWVYAGTVFSLDQRTEKAGRPMISNRGYVATREGVAALSEQLHAEALRRGLGRAKRVIVLADGASWIWKLATDRFKDAIHRVDFYHVSEHLWAAARQLHSEGAQQKAWVKRMKTLLRAGCAERVIHELEARQKEHPAQAEALEAQCSYLRDHLAHMDYASALRRGEPIGSGAMESTCRQYQCRFKRPGQFWTKAGDEGLMCLETFWRNRCWHILFPHTARLDPSLN